MKGEGYNCLTVVVENSIEKIGSLKFEDIQAENEDIIYKVTELDKTITLNGLESVIYNALKEAGYTRENKKHSPYGYKVVIKNSSLDQAHVHVRAWPGNENGVGFVKISNPIEF